MIFSDYFYKCKLKNEEYKITPNPNDPNDNRFFPARSFEVFPVWYEYIRKFYPNEHIIFFDNFSEIPFEEAAKLAGIDEFEIIPPESYTFNPNIKIHVKQFKDQYWYFHAVQRQRVESIKFAYLNNLDYFWIDTDCLINTNLLPFIENQDIFAPSINDFQQTIDAHCIFISNKRLHAWDNTFNLIELLEFVLNKAPDDNQGARHSILFEGGMYKLFCYGKANENININISHSSCYNNFIKWLKLNPLNSNNYNELLNSLINVNKDKLKNVLLEFTDTCEIAS